MSEKKKKEKSERADGFAFWFQNRLKITFFVVDRSRFEPGIHLKCR